MHESFIIIVRVVRIATELHLKEVEVRLEGRMNYLCEHKWILNKESDSWKK